MLRVFWRFREPLRPYRLLLAIGTVLTLVVAAMDVASPWPLKVVVDNVLKRRALTSALGSLIPRQFRANPNRLLAAAIVALLLIAAIGALADYLGTFVLDGIGERLTAELRSRIFEHLERLSLTYHDRQRVGDLTSRITGDVDNVQDMVVAVLSVLFPNLLVLFGIVIVMALADPQFTLVALATAPLLFVSTYSYTRRIKRASKEARRKEGEVASLATETLSSIRVVQAYTSERRHYRRFSQRNLERMTAGLEVVELQSRFSPVVDMIAAGGLALVLWFGVHRVLAGEMTLGVLLVFVAYLSQLYKPMRNLSKLASVVSRGQASAERVDEILRVRTTVVERDDATSAPRFAGAVEVQDVTFGYEPGSPVLRGVTLRGAPGEVIALAGATGAGKSTLVSLLPRFYDPWEGRVLIDGHDVREFELQSLRRRVALVLQDTILFYGTIYDNIAYGADRASRDQVIAAAKAAYVDEFVSQLPEGYETLVSERGATLSGGQRQRIAIARALVRDAPIVILDEPTANLDALSERYVLRSLDRLMAGRTVFVIAHRLSTLRHADHIHVLEHGEIVETGTHEELAVSSKLYREMYAVQVGAPAGVASSLSGDPKRPYAGRRQR